MARLASLPGGDSGAGSDGHIPDEVTIPGVSGNMSVNLPFLMLSVITLSATESILIACASTIIQTLPKDGSKLKAVRVLFNVSMMAFASGAAGLLFHQQMLSGLSWVSAPLLMAATTATFFWTDAARVRHRRF